jgi:hypothetical protein
VVVWQVHDTARALYAVDDFTQFVAIQTETAVRHIASSYSNGWHGNTVSERKGILLRLDPAVHDALAKWAADELRSTNAQIEFLLRRALADAGRLPSKAGEMRRPGRPRSRPPD